MIPGQVSRLHHVWRLSKASALLAEPIMISHGSVDWHFRGGRELVQAKPI